MYIPLVLRLAACSVRERREGGKGREETKGGREGERGDEGKGRGKRQCGKMRVRRHIDPYKISTCIDSL